MNWMKIAQKVKKGALLYHSEKYVGFKNEYANFFGAILLFKGAPYWKFAKTIIKILKKLKCLFYESKCWVFQN